MVFPTDNEAINWKYIDDQRLAFSCHIRAFDSVETTVDIEACSLDAEQCSSTVAVEVNEKPISEPLSERIDESTRIASDGHGKQGAQPETQVLKERSSKKRTDRQHSDSDSLGIGIIATGKTTEAVLRILLDSLNQGYVPFVIQSTGSRIFPQHYADRLGVTLLEVSPEPLSEDLVKAAFESILAERAIPGVILTPNSGRLDFEQSERAFYASKEAVVTGVPKRSRATVIAGIPAYNEADTIGPVVRQVKEYVDEVVVVDDGSSDLTAHNAKDGGATVISHEINQGYGGALKTLFKEAADRDVEHLVILDADDQHDPEDIPRLLSAQKEQNAQIVIGNRFGGTSSTVMPLYRRFGLEVINWMVNLSLWNLNPQERIKDAQSGYRVYDSRAISLLTDDSTKLDDQMSASIDILYCAHENDLAIAEIGTTIEYDVSNANTHNPFLQGLNVANHVIRRLEQKRPITVLGIPGFLVALAGTGVGYWMLSRSITEGSFSPGLASVSAILVLIGIFSSFTSIILHSLNTHFEQRGQ
ncbi:glycosyltransferase family 2 protein [Halobaculum limi]|uniref:glycosyltransferase family 2 protein n=1 Tax=Halobaculum limi TaxID=3031916 RepID=UPI00240668DC|nr:glycosyltransferase family 2 protein [Halobaculum sp. YSMS11]